MSELNFQDVDKMSQPQIWIVAGPLGSVNNNFRLADN